MSNKLIVRTEDELKEALVKGPDQILIEGELTELIINSQVELSNISPDITMLSNPILEKSLKSFVYGSIEFYQTIRDMNKDYKLSYNRDDQTMELVKK